MTWRFVVASAVVQMPAKQKKNLRGIVNCRMSPVVAPLMLQHPIWDNMFLQLLEPSGTKTPPCMDFWEITFLQHVEPSGTKSGTKPPCMDFWGIAFLQHLEPSGTKTGTKPPCMAFWEMTSADGDLL